MAGSILSLKVSSLAVLFSLPFGDLFLPGYWCVAWFNASVDSVCIYRWCRPVVVGYLLLVSMGRRGFIGERLYDWFGITFTFRLARRGSRCRRHVVSADGAGNSSGAGRG